MYGDVSESVHVVRLHDHVPAVYELDVSGPEIDAIRRLYCAVSEEDARRSWRSDHVLAAFSDAQRWRAATDAMLRTAERLRDAERDATRHLRQPWPRTRRLAWSVRHAHRNRVLRRDHDATLERLRTEMLSAYRRFRDQAADLTTHIEAERARYERERREREERARRRRADAMAGPLDVPRWSYCIKEPGSLKYRRFQVSLEILDDERLYAAEPGGELRGGLTPSEVHAAFVEQREQDPYLWLTFGLDTERAMEEWQGSTARAWQEITGHEVDDEYPTRPDDHRYSQRFYGPSSNYFSPGGFGSF